MIALYSFSIQNNAIFQAASFCLPILLAIVLFAVLCSTMKKYKQFEYDILRSEESFEIYTSFLRKVIRKSISIIESVKNDRKTANVNMF